MAPFFDDLAEPDDEADVLTAVTPAARPTAWSWAPPRLHVCPVCGTTVLTREPSPRCRRCGAWEDE